LDSLGDKVNLRQIAEEYQAVIREFYEWFGERQTEIHRNDFAELRRLNNELKSVKKTWLDSWGRGG
jgi:hypothetical protein